MNVTLTIPETIFEQSSGEIARELLERAVLEAFRVSAISLGRLAEILDLTIDEANGFLKAHTQISREIRPMDKVSMCRISREKAGINIDF